MVSKRVDDNRDAESSKRADQSYYFYMYHYLTFLMTGEQWAPGLDQSLAYGFALGRTLHVQTHKVKSVRFLKT